MDPEILSIRLSEEAKRWDEMVDRLDSYLNSSFQKKINMKSARQQEEQAKASRIPKAADPSEEVEDEEPQLEKQASETVEEVHIDIAGIPAKRTYEE